MSDTIRGLAAKWREEAPPNAHGIVITRLADELDALADAMETGMEKMYARGRDKEADDLALSEAAGAVGRAWKEWVRRELIGEKKP